jgi:hypothetical protein
MLANDGTLGYFCITDIDIRNATPVLLIVKLNTTLVPSKLSVKRAGLNLRVVFGHRGSPLFRCTQILSSGV